MKFTYTASPCNGTPDCEDFVANPNSVAEVVVANGVAGQGGILFQGVVVQGTTFTVTDSSPSGCLPDAVEVFTFSAGTNSVLQQAVRMDTSCSARGAILAEPYGSVDFVGYSCDSNDVHNCFEDIIYTSEACNTGTIDLTITEFELNANGQVINLLDGANPDDLDLGLTECFAGSSERQTIERCSDNVYVATSRVDTDGPAGCEDEEELRVEINVGTLPPTPAPTPSPTPAPIPGTLPPSPAPSEQCELGIELTCEPPEGVDAESCETIPPYLLICEDRPFSMTFRYNGGDCSGSFNVQPDTLFQCEDFQGGPPTERGTLSYIEAFELGGGEMYFSGFVEVESTFIGLAEDQVAANMNITIYDPRGETDPSVIVNPANILQTVIYHSSCSQNLYLKDRFGSIQLVEFINEEQGVVTCFLTAEIGFTFTAPIEIEGEAILSALTVITNTEGGPNGNGIYNLTDEVYGVIISPDDDPPFSISATIPIDLTVRRPYTALATIIGETGTVIGEGNPCVGVDFFEFTAGNPLPPIFPTLAPSASPTISPFPTPDPEESACDVDADISCALVRGGSCSNLQSPAGLTCLGDKATELRFIYQPNFCEASNTTQDRFRCNDDNEEIPRPNDVYMEVEGTGKDGVVIFQGTVSAGQILAFAIPAEDNDEIDVNIFTSQGGDELQDLRISTRCRERDQLTVLDVFGSLQLVGFTNPDLGANNVREQIRISYTASNSGRLNMDLRRAFKQSVFGGFETLLDVDNRPGDFPIVLTPREEQVWTELLELNLLELQGSFQFTFLASGINPRNLDPNDNSCTDNDTFTLRIS